MSRDNAIINSVIFILVVLFSATCGNTEDRQLSFNLKYDNPIEKKMVIEAIKYAIELYAINGILVQYLDDSPYLIHIKNTIKCERGTPCAGQASVDKKYAEIETTWLRYSFTYEQKVKIMGFLIAHELGHLYGLKDRKDLNCNNLMNSYQKECSIYNKTVLTEQQREKLQ